MLDLTLKQLTSLSFRLYADNPVIRRFGTSPMIADPSVLTPDRSPDGKWHLFAHALWGVYRFESEDGIDFRRSQKVVPRAMRPDIKRIGDTYYLFYERLQPLLGRAVGLMGGTWRSEIFAVTTKDLKTYSEPFPVLRFDRTFERVGRKGYSLSNPFLFPTEEGYRLYYSAGLTYIPDCKFTEPTYICLAESDRPDCGYRKREMPIIEPDPQSKLFNLCCGCLKVYRLKACYIGIQNGLYRDGKNSKSAIQLLKSEDGIHFTFVKTLLEPQAINGSNWMKQFVYASHLVQYGNKLRLYFNARNTAFILTGREHIGFAEAEIAD